MVELPTDLELEQFKEKVQNLLPGYLRVDVHSLNSKDSIEVLFRFVDNAVVTERVKLVDITELDKQLAKKVIISMIDKSIMNIKEHEERLEKLRQSVLNK